jgi:hypothetical protein
MTNKSIIFIIAILFATNANAGNPAYTDNPAYMDNPAFTGNPAFDSNPAYDGNNLEQQTPSYQEQQLEIHQSRVSYGGASATLRAEGVGRVSATDAKPLPINRPYPVSAVAISSIGRVLRRPSSL